jgi:hypothetical protein
MPVAGGVSCCSLCQVQLFEQLQGTAELAAAATELNGMLLLVQQPLQQLM